MKRRMEKKAKAAHKTNAAAIAIHAEHNDGEHHVVGLGNIRVLLVPEEGGWFAQGLDIDYAAQGDSIEQAKSEFEAGLRATVQEHLRVHGNIGLMLRVAPDEMWKLANGPDADLRRYTQVTTHHIIRQNSNFEGIEYLLTSRSAA